MADIVRTVCPMAYEAFEDYSLKALGFSGPELAVLKDVLADVKTDKESLVSHGLSGREVGELLDKLEKIKRS